MSAVHCDYCSLPLAGMDSGTAEPAQESRGSARHYCCFGCQFAASIAEAGGEAGQNRWTMARLGIAIFFAMNVMMFTMALWSQDWADATASDRSASALLLNDLLRYLSLLLSLPVLFLLGEPIVTSSLSQLAAGRWSTDLLLLAGVAASYVYSVFALLHGAGHVYFEVACAVLVAVTLGRWLEATGKQRTTEALEGLAKLLPATVHVETNEGVRDLPLDDLQPGMRVRVLAGERIPTDGVLRRGQAAIDEQLVTGESSPRRVEVGAKVFGGTLNLDGDLSLEVTQGPREGSLQRLVAAVRTAVQTKGEHQRLADRLASWFLPAVALVALATFAIHAYRGDALAGLMSALAVVVIACPCALGVATPLAIWAALGRAARAQVLIRSGDALCQLAGARVLAFDKTGTLTTGDHRVTEVWHDSGMTGQELAERILPLAASSIHTHCRALVHWCGANGTRGGVPVIESSVQPGLGVSATYDGTEVVIGSPRFMIARGLTPNGRLAAAVETCQDRGETLVCAGWEGQVRCVFALAEAVRPEARAVLRQARRDGCEVIVLTGDHAARAACLQRELDVEVRAELLPEQKLEVIQQLRAEFGRVVMIGDGANDAPALAGADVGIALGCGADVSRQTADVCLLASDLSRIPWTLELARQASATIWQNLFWAFAYNAAGIVIAVTGYLHPAFAAAAMVVSSGFVVANSLRLATANGIDAERKQQAALKDETDLVRVPSNISASASSAEWVAGHA